MHIVAIVLAAWIVWKLRKPLLKLLGVGFNIANSTMSVAANKAESTLDHVNKRLEKAESSLDAFASKQKAKHAPKADQDEVIAELQELNS